MSNQEPDPEYTRLHITPLNPSLITTILPASILPSARNISYHSIQTFPEKSYGYVDLPMADAERIKKKLNGSILKGTKVRIEKARPGKEAVIDDADEVERPKKERKKRKRDQLEVPGIDIGERHVKRGWTVPTKDKGKGKEKDKVAKSKFTTQPECLFKTVLPPNKVANAKGGLKKSKDKKKGKESLVHEFERTVKYATFLRAPGGKKSKGVVEYIEGKGWVDEDGNVVEVVKIRKAPAKDEPKPAAKEELMAESSSEESSGEDEEGGSEESESKIPDNKTEEDSSIDDSSSDEGSDHKDVESSIPAFKVDEDNSEESSSEDSSSEEESDHVPDTATLTATKAASTSSEASSESSEEESSSESEDEPEEPQSAITSRPESSSGPGLTIKIPDSMTSTPIASSVHPLEAIYKRKVDEKPNAGSFSFFEGRDGEDIEVETRLQVPLTPFTQKDFEFRGIRSAAPTPDTAHPNKRFVWPTDNDDDDDDEGVGEANSPIREAKGKEKEAEPESDFQKWFWENRGNVNRAWKKRRKVVAKEKRQRENRKRQDRAI
jgi:hypothetical protein